MPSDACVVTCHNDDDVLLCAMSVPLLTNLKFVAMVYKPILVIGFVWAKPQADKKLKGLAWQVQFAHILITISGCNAYFSKPIAALRP